MTNNFASPKIFRAILVLFSISTLFFWSCEKDPDIIGLDVLPPDDAIFVSFDTSLSLNTRTILDDSIRSDEDNLSSSRSYNLLGSYLDPVFGKSRADFVTEIRLSSNNVDFGDFFHVDSMKLFLEVAGLYGEPRQSTPQNIYVYRLTDTLSKNEKYYSNLNVEDYYDPSLLLGQTTIYPNYGDSVIAIDIDTDPFIEILTDTSYLADNEIFTEIFKGIYVTTDPVDFSGNIISIASLSDNSHLRLYYHNYPSYYPIVPANTNKTYDFEINEECARINLFYHNYMSAENPIPGINDTTYSDSLIYVQAMGGVKAKIDFNDINKWKDSVDVVINNAKLIIPVYNNSADLFEPVPLLGITYDNEDGDNAFIPDILNNGTYYFDYFDGVFNNKSNSYEFNITLYIQGLIDGSIPDTGFYLHPVGTENTIMANRVILKGPEATNGMRIYITYMKL